MIRESTQGLRKGAKMECDRQGCLAEGTKKEGFESRPLPDLCLAVVCSWHGRFFKDEAALPGVYFHTCSIPKAQGICPKAAYPSDTELALMLLGGGGEV